jgi:hypothetical protein
MQTIKQVSDRTGISTATLRRWIAEGKIKGAERSQIKIGSGNVWLLPDDVEIPEPEEAGKRHPNYVTPKNEGLTQLN